MTMLKGKKDVLHGNKPQIPDFLRVEPDEEEKKYQKVCMKYKAVSGSYNQTICSGEASQL
jgi:hypothetical protein